MCQRAAYFFYISLHFISKNILFMHIQFKKKTHHTSFRNFLFFIYDILHVLVIMLVLEKSQMSTIQISGQARAESFIYSLLDQTTLKSARFKPTLFTAHRLLSSFKPFRSELLSQCCTACSSPLIGSLDSNGQFWGWELEILKLAPCPKMY